MAQAVGRYRDTVDMSALGKPTDDRLDRADRQGGFPAAEKQRSVGIGARPLIEILAQGLSHRGIERHLSLLAPLAVADPKVAGALAQLEIGKTQGADLANP
jgi:hypothetical protein